MPSASIPDAARVADARRLLAAHLPRTRLIRAAETGRAPDRVFFKLEPELPTGSFKVRGALYALAVNLARGAIREVVASSTGNHGAAVAYAAARYGIPATIFLPRHPNPIKVRKILDLGARIVEEGKDLTEAFELADQHAAGAGAYFMQDTTDPDIPVGAGTMASEILEDAPNLDVIYAPVGDTALIRGVAAVAKHIKPDIRIVGVQAAQAPAYRLSWREGTVISTDTADTIADGLATRTPIEENVHAIRALVDEVRLVSEDEMLEAIHALLLREHIVAEPAGAAAFAAYSQERDGGGSGGDGRTLALLVTGANISPDVLRRAAAL